MCLEKPIRYNRQESLSKCAGKEEIVMENLRDFYIKIVHECNQKAGVEVEKHQWFLMDRANIPNIQRDLCFLWRETHE